MIEVNKRSAAAVIWILLLALPYWLPWVGGYQELGTRVLVMALAAMSLNFLLGFTGVLSFGHAAYFGLGAYGVGMTIKYLAPSTSLGILIGVLAGTVAAAIVGALIVRLRGVYFAMVTIAFGQVFFFIAFRWNSVTGGADGLAGMQVGTLLGFRFDFFGRTAYVYCGTVLFLGWLLMRRLVTSPFGRSLTGIRENVGRMHAIGSSVFRRLLAAYVISAALAGIAGALVTQITQFVGLNTFSLDRSGTLLVMLILGGVGRLYGAFIGVPLYMILQDRFSSIDPIYWYFWMGLMLVLVVVFAPGGAFGLIDRFQAWRRRRA